MLDVEIRTPTFIIEGISYAEDIIKPIDWKKPVKRAVKRSRDNTGKVIELHPTKGWRRVRGAE